MDSSHRLLFRRGCIGFSADFLKVEPITEFRGCPLSGSEWAVGEQEMELVAYRRFREQGVGGSCTSVQKWKACLASDGRHKNNFHERSMG
jgi:hypothetical protein